MTPAILWRAVRAYSLPASIVPVVLGTALAARGYGTAHGGSFDRVSFVLVLLGAVLAHCGANVLNDYFDFIKGVDTRPEHGSGVLTSGRMTPHAALLYSVILFAIAAVCAAILLREHAYTIVPLALIGLACAVLYPLVLKHYGLGDLLVMLAFGIALTLGAYGVQAGGFSRRQIGVVTMYSLPICLLVDAILNANNIRDAADDRAAHVHTLATLLGARGARAWQLFLLFGPVVFVVLAVLFGTLSVWSFITFLALPLLIRAYRTASVEITAQTHLVFGLLYAFAFLPQPVFV